MIDAIAQFMIHQNPHQHNLELENIIKQRRKRKCL